MTKIMDQKATLQKIIKQMIPQRKVSLMRDKEVMN